MKRHFQPIGDPIKSVDIVVCIHNALADVQRCLDALVVRTDPAHRIILIDDGSEDECRDAVKRFGEHHPRCRLMRNQTALGYTKAANQGLRASTADLVVLLNSDTIVTFSWLERIIECAASSTEIGIVGPLSNAAAYQSVPERFDADGEFTENPLPSGWSPEQIADVIATVSVRSFPRVPFVNGFCFAIKRRVIEKIGYFDDGSFPYGYGEEDDYCLRATAAGFQLAIADHAYVYHAKSRSYPRERRRQLKRAGSAALRKKHGQRVIYNAVARLDDEPTLAVIRQRLALCLSEMSPPVSRAQNGTTQARSFYTHERNELSIGGIEGLMDL